jgi:hypothetical protein
MTDFSGRVRQGGVPRSLHDPIYAAAIRRFRRSLQGGEDQLAIGLYQRWERRLKIEPERALTRCSYRYPFISGPAGGLNATADVRWDDAFPVIAGELTDGGMMGGGVWGCSVSVEIGASWSRVWRRGLAVIDRKFVLEIVADGDSLIVRSGRQRRDFTVGSCLARVTRSGRLCWLDETDA